MSCFDLVIHRVGIRNGTVPSLNDRSDCSALSCTHFFQGEKQREGERGEREGERRGEKGRV